MQDKRDKIEIAVKVMRQGKIYDVIVETKISKPIPIGASQQYVEHLFSDLGKNIGSDAANVYNRERFEEE